MIKKNGADVVDLVFGGSDHHDYCAEMNPNTGVFLTKGGSNFGSFTNFTMLTDVTQNDFIEF